MKDIETAAKAVQEVINAGPFAATWESLEDYRIPRWYKDAKFGIFIHWGVYSVPAFGNEWYPRNMYRKDDRAFAHHRAKWGDQSQFGYKDFIPLFGAEKFDPGHWADLFARAGAKFVVPVAEHHDGFAMYDCGFSKWCAAEMGPKRDVIGELATHVRDRGMVYGLSSHRAEHWWFLNGGMEFDSDVRDERWRDFYGPAQRDDTQPDGAFLREWLARTCEIVDKYQPQILWFDWWINEPAFAPYLRNFAAYYYNRAAQWGQGVAINYKNQAFPDETAVFDVERGQLTGIRPLLWQSDTSVSKNSWGYIEGHDYKTAAQIIGDLVDIVSKNGVLLLNIGPRADGTIPEAEEAILLEIGRWLSVNGEAIYGTRPWKVFGEGRAQAAGGVADDNRRLAFTAEDIRFTAKGDALYAVVFGWPESGGWAIKALADGSVHAPLEVVRVQLLGSDAPLRWKRDREAMTIELPSARPCDHAYVFKIEGKVHGCTPSGE